MRQFRQELIELLLALTQFTTTGIVDSKQSHDAVDNQKPIFVADEELSYLVKQFHLMLGIDSACVCDIVLG